MEISGRVIYSDVSDRVIDRLSSGVTNELSD